MNAYHLTRREVKHGRGVTDKTRGDVRAKETESCQPTESPRDTQRPQLVDDRPRFQNVKDRPVFFPTSPEWFHLGSYDAPLVRDVRGPAPLVEWSNSPLGGFGVRTERQTYGESEHLRHSRDLVYHQRIGFNNTCETTGHRLPVKTSVTFRQREGTYLDDTYKEVPYGSVPLWTNPSAVIQNSSRRR
jgi:hypothetical protein